MWYKKWNEKKENLNLTSSPAVVRRAASSSSFIDLNYLNFGHWNFTLITILDKER